MIKARDGTVVHRKLIVEALLGELTSELEAEYAAGAASVANDPMGLLSRLAEGSGLREQSLIDTPWATSVSESLAFGLGSGHRGFLDDGSRTVQAYAKGTGL